MKIMSKRFVAHRIVLRPAPPGAPVLGATGGAKDGTKGKSPAEPQARNRREIGGPEGPEPTRFGDWERKGICVDF